MEINKTSGHSKRKRQAQQDGGIRTGCSENKQTCEALRTTKPERNTAVAAVVASNLGTY